MSGLVAGVCVESAVYAIDKPYSYLVPEGMEAKRGCRVLVPFGASDRRVQGLIVEVREEEAPLPGMKAVAVLLDREPVLSEEQFSLVEFLRTRTFCTCYEAVRTVLPLGMNVSAWAVYRFTGGEEQLAGLSSEERRIAEYLTAGRTEKELAAFLGEKRLPGKNRQVKSLLEAGLLERTERLRPRVSEKTLRLVRLRPGELPSLTPKQRAAAEFLRSRGSAQIKEVCYFCGVAEGVVRALVRKGAAELFDCPLEDAAEAPDRAVPEALTLSPEQEAVCGGLWEMAKKGEAAAALLYGVTGSGKTQIYLKLIQRVVESGRTALMLVPEISLTPQLLEKFQRFFGGAAAVIHSGLTPAERLSSYRRIREGRVKIVIGTRSAVFSPLQNIGVIILDEEGEGSYKSDSAPRYHARDVAKFRCAGHRCLLLLGSATPSVDSYYQAQRGRYRLFTLERRFAQASLPHVYLVDMREEWRRDPSAAVSGLLGEQLVLNWKAGEQSILLLNRRGYHTTATCMQCGQELQCPNCDVAMTYHRDNGRLMCHTCGHTEVFTPRCPGCGSPYIKLTGAGTQKLEEELSVLLPQARILRMDTDTTYSRYSYERSFEAFRKGSYQVLLGTQMIAKGLDFPNVTLVGVVGADGGLYSGDYRASERIFSLITQVVGRSGRSEKAGRAYIQTFNPDNPVLNFAARQDYPAFYADEIVSRRALLYPPFCGMVTVGLMSAREASVVGAAERALALLREEAAASEGVAIKVLGAAPAPVYRAGGKYRYRIVMKCRMNGRLREMLARFLRRCGGDKAFSGVTVYADSE